MSTQSLISLIDSAVGQQGRLLKLDTPLGSDLLLPQRVAGHSRIGRNYDFTVDVLASDTSIELKSLIAQPVTLWIQQTDGTYMPHHGFVHTVRRLGADGPLTSFQIAFSSWLHFLRFRKDARIFQDQSVESILQAVFNEHPQARGAYRFSVRKETPVRSFCVQYEDDWNFVHRLMESEGLFGYFEQAADGKSHTFIVTDDVYTLPPLHAVQVDFSRGGVNSETDAFVQWSGTRTLQSAAYATSTFDYKSPSSQKLTSFPTMGNQGALPEQTEVYEYTGAYSYLDSDRGDHLTKLRLEEWESQSKRFTGVGGVRRLDAGRYLQLKNHPEHDQGSAQDREFAVLAVDWYIENNLPAGNTEPFPHSLERLISARRADYEGSAIAFTTHASDGSAGFYLVEAELQRRSVPFRSPFEHRKPDMRMQTATVVGPAGEEIHTDGLNRIKARMHWDRRNNGDQNASCWLRVMFSDSGGNYGGVHVPRIGEEVVVDWLDGDCDRPLVTGRLYNGRTTPHWHSNGLLSGYKSREFAGAGYNQLVMDDSTGQNRVQLYSTSANAALHLGYLVAQSGNARGAYLGAGFDLSADAFGAVRAARGLFVSTDNRTGPTTQPLDAADATSQLTAAGNVMEAQSDSSVQHKAESLEAGHSALKHLTAATKHSEAPAATGGQTAGGGTGNANGFNEPLMLFSSPAGIAMSTTKSVHAAATEQLNLVSGESTYVAAGKSLIASVAESISLFAKSAGAKLFAAAGKIDIQAQTDQMALAALKDLTITSSDGKIVIAAKSEVWVGAAGSFIQINGNGVTTASPGKIQEKGASWSMEGAASHSANLPVFPSSSDDDYEIVEQGFVRLRNGTIPVDDYHYDLISDGEIHTQKGSYAAGETARVPGQTNLSLVSWIAKDSAGRYE